jgi:hypothetical protein
MSLRRLPTRTPALVAAVRRNGARSRGPRTAIGKRWSRLNALRRGARSRRYRAFLKELAFAPPGGMPEAARRCLRPEESAHRVFRNLAEAFGVPLDEVEAELRACQNLFLTSEPGMSFRISRCVETKLPCY